MDVEKLKHSQVFWGLETRIARIKTNYADLWFGVWSLGFGVWGLGFGVWKLKFGIWSLEIEIWNLFFHTFTP